MEICYPVYQIPNSVVPSTDGKVTFTYSEVKDEDDFTFTFRVLDDKNMPGNTLGRRRLLVHETGAKLQRVGRAIFFLGDLIKLAKRHTYFIDTNGRVFQYRKSSRAKLHFKKITQVIPIATGGAILEVEGVHSRFKCLFQPKTLEIYAGILEMGMTNILYGLYEQPYKSSWRMV